MGFTPKSADRRSNRLGKLRQDASVEAVGLGQLPGRTGKIANLSRIDEGERQTCAPKEEEGLSFEAAGGLKNDEGGGKCLKLGKELVEPVL